ncbi:MAG: hypothetical protein PGN26_14605 [Xylophilus ampelinus]
MIAGSLEIELMANIARLQKDMDSAKGTVDAAMGAIQRSVKSAQAVLVGLGTGFATALTVASFKNIVMGVVETGAALDDLRMQTGSTVEALSGLAAVGKFNNMSAEQIGGAMNMLAKNMAGATEESKGASKALEALGIDFDTFKKLRPEEQMQKVAGAMSEFEDGTGKSAVAMALYGKQGAQMLPFLHDLAEVSGLQAKMTTEQATAAANFDDNLTRLTTSGDAWKKELAAGMLPALDQTAQALLEVLNSSGGLRDEVKRLSKDGSVAEWTRNAVTGFSYVVDAGEIVIRMIKGLGTALGGAMASTVTGVGAIAEAWSQIQKGDAFGAWDTLKSGASQVKTIIGETYSDIADIAKQPTLGANFRAAMAKQVADAQNAGVETRKALDFTNIADKGGKKASEAESEYAKLVKRIKERIDAAKQEQDAGRALTDQEKFALKVIEDMEGAKKALTQTERERIAAMLKTSAAENEATEQQRARIQFEKDLRASENQRIAAYEKTVQSSADANKQLRDEIEMIGLNEQQQLAVTQARIADTIAQKEQTLVGLQREGFMSREAIAMAEEIRLLRERSELLGQQSARTVAAKQVEAYQGEWTKFYDQLYQGLTDSLYRSFEAGAGFFRNMWEGIKNLAKTTVLKFVIQGLVSMTPLAGLSSAANAATGGAGALGMANSASSAYSLATNASTAYTIGSQVAGGTMSLANAAGTVFGNATTFGAGTALDGLLATNAAYGTAAPAAAGSAAGIGSTLMTAAPYLAAAAVVANVLGLFKSKKVTDVGITGNLAGNNETSLLGYTETRKGGSLISGPSYSRSQSEMPAEQVQAIRSATDAVYNSIASYGAALGLNADSIRGYVQAINLSTKGLTSEQITAALENQFAVFGDQLAARIAPGIGEFSKAGEQYRDTLTRLATSMGTVNGVMVSLGQRSLDLSLAGGAAASALLDLVGGAENLQTLASGYQQNFYTEAERTAITLRQVGASLGAVGLGLPQTRAEFRALVEAQDLMTASGRQAYAVLLGVSDAFASAVPEAAAAADSVKALAEAAQALAEARKQALQDGYALLERSVEAQRKLIQTQYDSAVASVAKLSGIAGKLQSTLDSMSLSGTEAQSRAAAQAQVSAALAIARAGGVGTIDIDALAPALSRVAQSSEALFTDYVSYARDYARTAADLQELNSLTGAAQTVADQQLAAAKGQLDRLDYILQVSKEHVDAINGVNVSTVSVHDAVLGLARTFAASTGVSHDAYASGSLGYLVATQGPQVYSAPQIVPMQGGAGVDLLSELQALRQEMVAMRMQSGQQLEKVVDSTQKTEKTLSDAARGNQPLMTTATA